MIEVKLNELYQEVILDHNRNPRNFGTMEKPSAYSHGVNPLCGDDYHLYLSVDGSGKINGVKIQGQGCAISKASASMMTEAIENKSLAQARVLGDTFIRMLTDQTVSPDAKQSVGRLKIFEGVKQYPVRVKCATLAWQALGDALKDLLP